MTDSGDPVVSDHDDFREWYEQRAKETRERWRDPDPGERKLMIDEIKHTNRVRGPKTPEEAAFYVEQGALDPEDVSFWLENRRQEDAYLDREFARRLRTLHEANGARPRTKTSIEDTPEIHELYKEGLLWKKENPRATWEQVARQIGVPYGTWRHWRRRLRSKVFI